MFDKQKSDVYSFLQKKTKGVEWATPEQMGVLVKHQDIVAAPVEQLNTSKYRPRDKMPANYLSCLQVFVDNGWWPRDIEQQTNALKARLATLNNILAELKVCESRSSVLQMGYEAKSPGSVDVDAVVDALACLDIQTVCQICYDEAQTVQRNWCSTKYCRHPMCKNCRKGLLCCPFCRAEFGR